MIASEIISAAGTAYLTNRNVSKAVITVNEGSGAFLVDSEVDSPVSVENGHPVATGEDVYLESQEEIKNFRFAGTATLLVTYYA